MSALDEIFSDVLALESTEKLQLIDKILVSLNPTNKGVEALWIDESEERITAYEQERVPAIDAQDVFKKYSK